MCCCHNVRHGRPFKAAGLADSSLDQCLPGFPKTACTAAYTNGCTHTCLSLSAIVLTVTFVALIWCMTLQACSGVQRNVIGWFDVKTPGHCHKERFPVYILQVKEEHYYGFPQYEYPGMCVALSCNVDDSA